MDQEREKNNSTKVEGGNVGSAFQSGSHKISDFQGIVNGHVDKSSNHIDNSKSQVITFEFCAKCFSFKRITIPSHLLFYYLLSFL